MLEIEITQTDIIDGGIQVFARAWRDGVQIGFGKDGTVDIERFRIFNPPVLVPDELGDIIITTPAEMLDGLTVTDELISRYREDPEEAALQVIEQAILSSGKEGGNIIVGKIGNTTSTFFTVEDDVVYKQDSASWDTTHDATVGSGNYGGGANRREFEASDAVRIFRGFHMFDTAAIDDTDTIDSATLSLFIYQVNDTDTTLCCIVEAQPTTDTSIVVGDFDLCGDAIDNPTEGAARIAFSSIVTTVYTVFTLNAAGLTWIDKTGVTGMGTRNSRDCDDAPPTGDNYVLAYGTAQAGTTQDPKLVVEHSAGGGPTVNSNFLTFM